MKLMTSAAMVIGDDLRLGSFRCRRESMPLLVEREDVRLSPWLLREEFVCLAYHNLFRRLFVFCTGLSVDSMDAVRDCRDRSVMIPRSHTISDCSLTLFCTVKPSTLEARVRSICHTSILSRRDISHVARGLESTEQLTFAPDERNNRVILVHQRP